MAGECGRGIAALYIALLGTEMEHHIQIAVSINIFNMPAVVSFAGLAATKLGGQGVDRCRVDMVSDFRKYRQE